MRPIRRSTNSGGGASPNFASVIGVAAVERQVGENGRAEAQQAAAVRGQRLQRDAVQGRVASGLHHRVAEVLDDARPGRRGIAGRRVGEH